MKHFTLTPSHSPNAARRRWERSREFLTAADYDLLVQESAIGTVDGETKFLFLKSAFPFTNEFYDVLCQISFERSKRAAGHDALFGYFFDRRNGPRPVLTNRTKDNLEFYNLHLSALLSWIGYRVRRELRSYWNEQRQAASLNGEYRVPRVPARPNRLRENLDYKLWIHSQRGFLCEFPLEPIFSTVTINRSAPFLPHCDAKNEGGLACLMAFGEFTGGDFCLPRLRVAFRMRPGDLLIADNNREYHGNVGAIAGDRISVVAYLRRFSEPEPSLAPHARDMIPVLLTKE
jgi:hypothetical protein